MEKPTRRQVLKSGLIAFLGATLPINFITSSVGCSSYPNYTLEQVAQGVDTDGDGEKDFVIMNGEREALHSENPLVPVGYMLKFNSKKNDNCGWLAYYPLSIIKDSKYSSSWFYGQVIEDIHDRVYTLLYYELEDLKLATPEELKKARFDTIEDKSYLIVKNQRKLSIYPFTDAIEGLSKPLFELQLSKSQERIHNKFKTVKGLLPSSSKGLFGDISIF